MTNKILVVACAALMLSAVIMFVAALPPDVPDNSAMTIGNIEKAENDTVYTVKSYGDKIGIFVNNCSEPVKTISIDPGSLPDEAQMLLKKGITVSGRDELLLLIEDYIS